MQAGSSRNRQHPLLKAGDNFVTTESASFQQFCTNAPDWKVDQLWVCLLCFFFCRWLFLAAILLPKVFTHVWVLRTDNCPLGTSALSLNTNMPRCLLTVFASVPR